MGLDMYLTKDLYVGEQYKHRHVTRDCAVIIDNKVINLDGMMESITMSIGYWRKANAIHNWFVTNVQGGTDECQKSYVSTNDLVLLKRDCIDVLIDNSLSEKLLPPTEGFFFGSGALDKYYFQDLEDTIAIINKALENDNGEFYYQSSW